MQESDRMNEVKKKLIWDQWQQGHPMSVIARSVHKPPATVFSYLCLFVDNDHGRYDDNYLGRLT